MIRDPGCRQLGSGMEKSRIRDKQPGSVTLCPTDTDTDPNPDPRVLVLPDPDPPVKGMDPDPSIIMQK